MDALVTVMVHLKDETTLKGALVEQTPQGLILRAAQMIENMDNQMRWVRLDGEIVVPLDNISFWQTGLDAELLNVTGRVE